MSKRKILMLAVSVCMVAILAVGGTLAYFTAEDTADNVFTMGHVSIDLIEDFVPNSPLAPGLDVNKDVSVKNDGSLPAYVRVHIAIPANMDDGDPSFAAVNNFLHFNFTSESVVDGKWSWGNSKTAKHVPGTGSKDWNFYTETVDGVLYNVYVVTHETAVAAGDTTIKVLDKVYLDKSVDATANADGTITYTDSHNNTVTLTKAQAQNIQIKVVAEATQVDTFADAWNALDTAFGKPATGNNPFAGYVAK